MSCIGVSLKRTIVYRIKICSASENLFRQWEFLARNLAFSTEESLSSLCTSTVVCECLPYSRELACKARVPVMLVT